MPLDHTASTPNSSSLKCAIPVFEGLLPEPHNSIITDLLYTLATWHALAKLRLHTEWSVTYFEAMTKVLGSKLRAFVKSTCGVYDTRELPREVAARGRRKSALATCKPAKPRKMVVGKTSHPQSNARKKAFSLRTYKLHALGDYPRAIRTFGTTDVYSTQPVSPHAFTLCSLSERFTTGRTGTSDSQTNLSTNQQVRLCGTNRKARTPHPDPSSDQRTQQKNQRAWSPPTVYC